MDYTFVGDVFMKLEDKLDLKDMNRIYMGRDGCENL